MFNKAQKKIKAKRRKKWNFHVQTMLLTFKTPWSLFRSKERTHQTITGLSHFGCKVTVAYPESIICLGMTASIVFFTVKCKTNMEITLSTLWGNVKGLRGQVTQYCLWNCGGQEKYVGESRYRITGGRLRGSREPSRRYQALDVFARCSVMSNSIWPQGQ